MQVLTIASVPVLSISNHKASKNCGDQVAKFSGNTSEDFNIWLADYYKAMMDYGWSGELRVTLHGSATKHTWQCTVSREDKTQWSSVVAI